MREESIQLPPLLNQAHTTVAINNEKDYNVRVDPIDCVVPPGHELTVGTAFFLFGPVVLSCWAPINLVKKE